MKRAGTMRYFLLGGLMAALAAAAPAGAADRSQGMGGAESSEEGRERERGQRTRGERTRLSERDVRSLRDRGYSWQDVGHALIVADQAKRPLSEVTSLHDSGMRWDEIAERFDVRFGEGESLGRIRPRRGGEMGEEEPYRG